MRWGGTRQRSRPTCVRPLYSKYKFPPPALYRLRKIKRKADPNNVFSQSFPAAGAAPGTGR
ncbi:BBE domain-containing protein [Glycomyces sp. NPDC021274]|uniref:BBE domain-containing protein n=1 Tax=Glycomyces sp. NPDC021274 TaxID=3155120 RepID=UPI0033E9EC91